jgi:prepilin-type N-terminal cleavage/methylation domain-containing protein
MERSMKRLPKRRRAQAGFTLIELLIVTLIVGILAGVGVPLYLGYVKDARSAEAKALAGSVFSALQGCAQTRGPGVTCTLTDVITRVGVDPTSRITADGRWTVDAASTLTLSTANPPIYTGTVGVSGIATQDTDGIAFGLIADGTGMHRRCDLTSNTPPTTLTAGTPC